MSAYLVERIEGHPLIDVRLCDPGHASRCRRRPPRRGDGPEAGGRDERLRARALVPLHRRCAADALGAEVGVRLNEAGYVLTGPDLLEAGRRPEGWLLDRDPLALETSVPGLFAAGDVRSGSTKRVAAAVGEGAMAVALVHRRLESSPPNLSGDLAGWSADAWP